MSSRLVNRNVLVLRARTSIRLEPELWDGLREIRRRERWTDSRVIEAAQAAHPSAPRTSALRCYILNYFRAAATEAGHSAANHGVLSHAHPATHPSAMSAEVWPSSGQPA